MDREIRTELMQKLHDYAEPFLVPVPAPYIVDLSYGKGGAEAMRKRLLQQAETLWKVLNLLEISAEEACAQELSLNRSSWDELYDRASRSSPPIKHESLELLNNGPWER